MNARMVRNALLVVEVLVGLSAVAGGVGLIAGFLGMPLEQLQGTPFNDYLIPGLILAIAVGGSHLVAASLLADHHPLAVLTSLAAGCVMMGWIVGEVILLGYISVLQPLMFAFGLLVFGLAAYLWLPQWRHAA